MKAAVLARLASFSLVVTLLPALQAAASARPANFGRHGQAGIHRPGYKNHKSSGPGRLSFLKC